jgi:hypothetical protein
MLWMSLAASSWKLELCVPSRETTPNEKSEFSTALHNDTMYGAANGIMNGCGESYLVGVQ